MAKHYLLAAAIILILVYVGAYLWHNSLTGSAKVLGSVPASAMNGISNATGSGFQMNATMLVANYSSQCVLQQISFCDNNEPSQFVCVNQAYSSNVSAQYHKIYSGRAEACPEFVLAGKISCAVSGNYCIVVDNRSS
jgi:hypothetical protein